MERGGELDEFIFVQDILRDYNKEKERKVNGIKRFVQRKIRNDIFRNTVFIKIWDGKVVTHYICKYSSKRARYIDLRRLETNIWGI